VASSNLCLFKIILVVLLNFFQTFKFSYIVSLCFILISLKMGSAKELTSHEKLVIDVLHILGCSGRTIARLLHRSQHAVSRYARRPNGQKVLPHTGRHRMLSEVGERHVCREASLFGSSCPQIKHTLHLPYSVDTIWRALRRDHNLKFQKMAVRQPLTPQQKVVRFDWAVAHLLWDEEWKSWIFSDEKKFNLDGPDGWAKYWHDIRREPRIYQKHHSGGGSVMCWSAFGWNGQCPIVFINGRVNSIAYTNILQCHLLPNINHCANQPIVFQLDNAPIHTSHHTKNWLTAHMNWHHNWPPYSPDLNVMENMWAILARHVYANGRQYHSVEELKQVIVECWNGITEETRRNLIRSMKKRMVEVVAGDGKAIDV
jgi:transposase